MAFVAAVLFRVRFGEALVVAVVRGNGLCVVALFFWCLVFGVCDV